MVRLTDRPDMTLDVYRGRKTTIQQQKIKYRSIIVDGMSNIITCATLLFLGTDRYLLHRIECSEAAVVQSTQS